MREGVWIFHIPYSWKECVSIVTHSFLFFGNFESFLLKAGKTRLAPEKEYHQTRTWGKLLLAAENPTSYGIKGAVQ